LPVVLKPSGARFKNTAAGSFRCGQRADCRHPGKLSRRILTVLQGAFYEEYSGSYTAERKRILCGPAERNLAGTFRPISPTARRTVVGIFPNKNSYLRLVTTYLMEYAEDWSVSRAYLNPKSIQSLLLNAA
jgi:hypothetical protein